VAEAKIKGAEDCASIWVCGRTFAWDGAARGNDKGALVTVSSGTPVTSPCRIEQTTRSASSFTSHSRLIRQSQRVRRSTIIHRSRTKGFNIKHKV
jgi:hypothetical protein